MKKLKGLILSCCMLTMCFSTAFASEITCDVGSKHLEISAEFGESYAYRMISLQLNGPFDSYCEFPDTIEAVGNEFKKLAKTEFITLYLDEKGRFSYDFYPKADNSFYTVAVNAYGFEKPWSKTILNVSDALEKKVIRLLNRAESSDEIKEIFDNQNYHNILTYSYPIFRNIEKDENKNLVYLALYNAKEINSFDNLTGNYGDEIIPISAVMNINEMAEDEMANARLIAEENINLENAPLYDFYDNMSQSEQENIFKRLLGESYSDVSEFIDSYDVAIYLQMIESEVFKNNLTQLLNDYAESYNVNIEGYEDNISAVNDAIYGQYYRTTEDLSSAISTAISENTGSGSGSGSSSRPSSNGSSGSGSGIGGGVYFPSVKNESTPVKTEIFSDLGSVAWAKEAIESLYDLGVVNGRGEKVFDPSANVKREEFVKMIFLATKQQQNSDTVNFTDVNDGAWYYPYIASGVKLGWIKGISETQFGVGNPLTRQDMAVLIARAAGISAESSQAIFADDNMISDYAKEAVYSLRNAGIINGDDANRFNPKAYTTRAEAAKVIYEMITKEGK